MDTTDAEEQTAVKVVIRVRPLNQRETEGNSDSVWNIDSSEGVISQTGTDGSVARSYAFDRVYAPMDSTKQIYTESILPVIKSFVAGFNGTIFAYGQTSSGKTYTMMGSGNDDGIIHRCIKHIFSAIRKTPDREFSIKVSYLEIYNEGIKDLLDPTKLDLKISMDALYRPYVRNLTQQCPLGADEAFKILTQGMTHRNIGCTKMNEQSSRSHTLFQIALESRSTNQIGGVDDDAAAAAVASDIAAADDDTAPIDTSVRSSVLNIVDLAGSERAKKTDAKGQRLKEGGHINKSLLVLGIIIKKLSELSRSRSNKNNEPQQHIPYRDSKLTHILEPALGGNSKTVVICTMTPADIHAEESVSTLGFASRAKEVKNCASVVELRDDATVIRQQRRQIQQLQRQLRIVHKRPSQQHQHGGDTSLTMPMNVDLDELSGGTGGGSSGRSSALNFDAERRGYERTIDRLKKLCKASTSLSTTTTTSTTDGHADDKHEDGGDEDEDDEDEDDDIAPTRKPQKQRSLLPSTVSARDTTIVSRKRHHSVAFDFREGTPARKRQRKELQHTHATSRRPPATTQASPAPQAQPSQQQSQCYSTPMNRVVMEKEAMQWKLKEANHIKQSLQHELNINYREFTAMQSESQRLREKCDFLEHALQSQYSQSDVLLENERLQSKIRALRLELERDKEPQRLRAELAASHGTIDELQQQIAALRINIEKQQHIERQLMQAAAAQSQVTNKESTPEQPHAAPAQLQLLRMHLHKLHSQIALLHDDRRCMRQSLHSEQQRVAQCTLSITHKLTTLREHYERVVDDKRMHEAQCMQLREECQELRAEVALCRRDPNELLQEVQSELLTVQKQYDIDVYHAGNVAHELESKLAEIEDLKAAQSKIETNAAQRERDMSAEYEQKVVQLQSQLAELKTLHDTLQRELSENASKLTSSTAKQKIDSMNANDLKTALKNAKKNVRDLQSKISSIERKKTLHEKSASQLNKKHNDLLQKHKLLKRECSALRHKLQSAEQHLQRVESKSTKQLDTIKGLQKEMVNGKEATRKIAALHKQLQSVQQKHAKLCADHQRVQQEYERDRTQLTQLKEEFAALQATHDTAQQSLQQVQHAHDDVQQRLLTEKGVSDRFKQELTKYHQLNGDQRNQLATTQEQITAQKQQIAALKQVETEHENLSTQHSRVQTALAESEHTLKTLQHDYAQLKQSESSQKHELAESNKMFRAVQSELNGNKRELAAYQNRWQTERAQNERSMEQLRQFELQTNHLNKELELRATAIEQKNGEIERLSAQCKQQQNELAQVRSECGENKNLTTSLQSELETLRHNCETLTAQKQHDERVMAETESALKSAEQKLENIQREFEQVSRSCNEGEHQLASMSSKWEELQTKYDTLRQEQKGKDRTLDEKETENLELNEEIEDLHIQFESERKRRQKEMDVLTEKLSAAQRECDLKRTELEMYGEIEKRSQAMELQYTQLVAKHESATMELKSTHQKLSEAETELKAANSNVRHITLQNERLHDDLNAVSNNSDLDVLKRKYVKAKEELSKRAEMIEKIKNREQRHVDKCRDAIEMWSAHCKKLEQQIEEQTQELQKLRPSNDKAKRFEKLCKEYHYARSMVEKSQMVCRQTQTDEIRMEANKENNANNG